MGEVAKPGPQPYTAGMTVATAIDAAGGVRRTARGDLVIVREKVRIAATRQTPLRAANQLVVP